MIMADNPKVQLMTLCDYAITAKDGKLSLIGLFDRIFTKQLPTRYSRFFLVAVLQGEAGQEFPVSLSITNPQGEDLLPARKIEIKFGPNGKANIITDVANLTFSASGDYQIKLSNQAETLATYTFQLVRMQPTTVKGAN